MERPKPVPQEPQLAQAETTTSEQDQWKRIDAWLSRRITTFRKTVAGSHTSASTAEEIQGYTVTDPLSAGRQMKLSSHVSLAPLFMINPSKPGLPHPLSIHNAPHTASASTG